MFQDLHLYTYRMVMKSCFMYTFLQGICKLNAYYIHHKSSWKSHCEQYNIAPSAKLKNLYIYIKGNTLAVIK